MKNKILCKIIIAFLAIIVLLSGIFLFSEKIQKIPLIENIKQAINEKNINSENSITTIDVTGITLGKETEHEHIYKTMYDETKHWEECTVCSETRNERTHSLTTTWASGKETCQKDNYYTKVCTCGYTETGHRPCVWNGSKYGDSNIVGIHSKMCSVCGSQIRHSYYLNSYGNGKVYNVNTDNLIPDFPEFYTCHLANGSVLTCNNIGRCVECNVTYSKKTHWLYADAEIGKIYCLICKSEFGTVTNTITKNSTAPTTYIVNTNLRFNNGATFSRAGTVRNVGNAFATVSSVKGNGTDTNVNLTSVATFKSTWKKEYLTYILSYANIGGVECQVRTNAILFYPDQTKPIITNVTEKDDNINEWNKIKTIIVSGTENYCDTVKIEILDDEENIVYEGSGNVTNGNYSVSCTPELEAGLEGRQFKAIVTDSCNNKTEKTFTISKIDGIAPEIKSDDKVSDGWAREKNMTFAAVDHGIGNVEIAFNDVSDYSLASKNGTEYSKEYKLVGDVYTQREANVYYKDELGNISTKKVIIDKLDNTAPTITGASFSNNKLNIVANDRHKTEGEGSGVVKYRFLTTSTKLEKPEITLDNSTEKLVNENIIIPEIYKVKYVYVVAEDLVGNVSDVYEVEVPQLELTSKVNLTSENGKGAIELDWSGYDIANKYFVIYRKGENETEWKTLVSLEAKFNGNKYTDNLANDKANPSTPTINIEGNIENNNIEITASSEDNGTKYMYYIEAYDLTDMSLLNISNEIST